MASTLVSRYRKGTDSYATDTLIAAPLGGGNDGAGRRTEDDPNLVAYGVAFRGRQDGIAAELTEGLAPSMRSGKGSASRGSHALTSGGVRRLMPVECERLQALPDGWTDLGGTPDSRRYAALGDAVTASVAEWIGRRILAA